MAELIAGRDPLQPQLAASLVAVDAQGNLYTRPGFAGFAFTEYAVDVGAVSTLLVAANANRKYLSIQNDSAVVIYVTSSGVAVLHQGGRLNPFGMAYELIMNMNLELGAVYAIADAPAGAYRVLVREAV